MPQSFLSFRAMGSTVQIWLETDGDGAAILAPIHEYVQAMEAKLSRFLPTSELTQANQNRGVWTVVSEPLLEVAALARSAASLTDGLYNPLIGSALSAAGYDRSFEEVPQRVAGRQRPGVKAEQVPDWRHLKIHSARKTIRVPARSSLDLGGIAKGWVAQEIVTRLSPYGACLADAGGDLVARGTPAGQDGWIVAVAEPDESDHDILSVIVRDQAVATSSTHYRRWQVGEEARHHLIDPRTGSSAQSDVKSATVIHSIASHAEACTKALILLGAEAGLNWFQERMNLTQESAHAAALVVLHDGAVMATSNFGRFIVSKEIIQ